MEVGAGKTYKLCPQCSFFSSTLEEGDYCPLCGATLISTCVQCKKPIDNPYVRFCRFCGKAYPGRDKEENDDKEI